MIVYSRILKNGIVNMKLRRYNRRSTQKNQIRKWQGGTKHSIGYDRTKS